MIATSHRLGSVSELCAVKWPSNKGNTNSVIEVAPNLLLWGALPEPFAHQIVRLLKAGELVLASRFVANDPKLLTGELARVDDEPKGFSNLKVAYRQLPNGHLKPRRIIATLRTAEAAAIATASTIKENK